MTISEMLLPEFDREAESTRKLLAAVPEDKYGWKPHGKSMAMGRLASHIAEMHTWGAHVINDESLDLTPEFKPLNASTKQELMDYFEKGTKDVRAAIAGASDEHLAKPWTLSYGGKPIFTMPRSTVLRSVVLNHAIHHRGQLGVYLRLNDIAVPGMYGPSADEQ
jgi:uncharacterized damage-inducible protein DinB